MKNSLLKIFILALSFSVAMILGCGEGEKAPQTTTQPVQEEAKEEAKETLDEVKEEVGEAVDSVTEFTIEQKEEYTAKVNEQLLVMEEKIQELQDKAQALEGEAREKMEEQIDALSAMYEKAAHELANLKDQGMDTWSEAVQSIDTTMEQMEQAYQDAKANFE